MDVVIDEVSAQVTPSSKRGEQPEEAPPSLTEVEKVRTQHVARARRTRERLEAF